MTIQNDEERESPRPEMTLEEQMRCVLGCQSFVDATALQRTGEHAETVSAVVVSLPELASNPRKSWRNKWATVMWYEVPITGSSGLSIVMEHKEEVRIPISVKRCGPCLIACTVLDAVWDPAMLLLDVFLRGYGKAVFDGEGSQSMAVFNVLNVVAIGECSHKFITASSESSASSALFMRTAQQKREQNFAPTGRLDLQASRSTTYRLRFPTFHHTKASPASYSFSSENTVLVFVQRPDVDREQRFVKIPPVDQDLRRCTIILEYYDADLDLDELVAGLLELGCCSGDFNLKFPLYNPSWTLPDGGKVTYFSYDDVPRGSGRHESGNYQMDLPLLEQGNKDRFLMAQQDPSQDESSPVAASSSLSKADTSSNFGLDKLLTVDFAFPGHDGAVATHLNVLHQIHHQLMLLEQQNKQRQLDAGSDLRRLEPDEIANASNMSSIDALEDFDFDTFLASESHFPKLDAKNPMKDDDQQLQLMLLQQQSIRRHLMARQKLAEVEIKPTFGSPMSWNQSTVQSPMSIFGSPMSFMSASSPASFMTARSAYTSPALATMNGVSPVVRIETIREDEPPEPSMAPPLRKLRNDYYDHLHQQNIIQPFDKELNWSGKGQHVTFLAKDSIPLTTLSHLGASITAKVDKVLCRRIALARKTMRCSRQWTIADALREVYHLQNLRHFHIVQLVGSYLQGRDFSILMYPVADCHLGTFMDDTADIKPDLKDLQDNRRHFLRPSLICLTSALAYIHDQTTKHMDIKPQNILVRETRGFEQWRIYLADFGLSRSFASQDHSQTDGPTSRTPRYCAPEVFKYDRRGRSADIFSLGCVFIEMLTVCAGNCVQDFSDYRSGDGDDESFHANLSRVQMWIDQSIVQTIDEDSSDTHLHKAARSSTNLIKQMIAVQPETRPTAVTIYDCFSNNPLSCYRRTCCQQPPEAYVSYEEVKSPMSSPVDPSSLPNDFKLFSPIMSDKVLEEIDEIGLPAEYPRGIEDDSARVMGESPAKRRKRSPHDEGKDPGSQFVSPQDSHSVLNTTYPDLGVSLVARTPRADVAQSNTSMNPADLGAQPESANAPFEFNGDPRPSGTMALRRFPERVASGNEASLSGSFDPMLDSDPFGLSAGMHFPTVYDPR